MVVSCIAHRDRVADLQSRLAAASYSRVFEEIISTGESLLSIRTETLLEAEQVGGLLSRAGALQVDIDAEAA